MAKELVVTSTLTGEMIEAGAKRLERLEQEGLDIKAAMWLHQPESFIKWQLVVALPDVKQEGPMKFYRLILDAQNKIPPEESAVRLDNISVIDVSDPMIVALQKDNLKYGITDSYHPVTVRDGIYIEESYVYRLAPPPREKVSDPDNRAT